MSFYDAPSATKTTASLEGIHCFNLESVHCCGLEVVHFSF